jgi:hypothetical protein
VKPSDSEPVRVPGNGKKSRQQARFDSPVPTFEAIAAAVPLFRMRAEAHENAASLSFLREKVHLNQNVKTPKSKGFRHCLTPQTEESLQLLKTYRLPHQPAAIGKAFASNAEP